MSKLSSEIKNTFLAGNWEHQNGYESYSRGSREHHKGNPQVNQTPSNRNQYCPGNQPDCITTMECSNLRIKRSHRAYDYVHPSVNCFITSGDLSAPWGQSGDNSECNNLGFVFDPTIGTNVAKPLPFTLPLRQCAAFWIWHTPDIKLKHGFYWRKNMI